MRRRGFLILALLVAGLLLVLLASRRQDPAPPLARGERADAADGEDQPRLHGRAPSEEGTGRAETPPPTPPAQARITGRVLDFEGSPAAGARVWVAELHGEWRTVYAGADGRFVLDRAGGATPPIVATAPQCGYGAVTGPFLTAGGTRDVGTIRLGRGYAIEGQVVDEDGAPYAEVDVSLWTETQPVPADWSGMWRADAAWSGHATDAEGRFAFQRLPAGSYWISATAHDGAGGKVVLEHVTAGSTDVRFVIPRPAEEEGLAFTVIAVGPDGAAIPRFNADLSARRWQTGAIGTAEEPAALWLDEGRPPFRILVYQATGASGEPLGYAPVLLENVAPRSAPYMVQMGRPGLEIRGRIVWDGAPRTWHLNAYGQIAADGRSAVDQVHVRPPLPDLLIETKSDAADRFVFRGLPPGRVELSLDSGSEGVGRIRGGDPVVEAGSTNVVLEIVPMATLSVVVRAPEGATFDTVLLTVHRWKDAGARRVGRVTLIAEASYRQRVDPDGLFHVVAEGRRDDVLVGRAVLRRATPRDEPYELVLEAAPLVCGRVVTADDVPIADARVRLYAAEGGPWRRLLRTRALASEDVFTAANGSFAVRAPHGGRFFVVATSAGLTPLPHPPLIEGGAKDVRVVLRPSLSVAGRISDPAGEPTSGLRVTALPAKGAVGLWRDGVTFGGGFFDVTDLAAGAYRIVAWHDDDDPDNRYVLSAPVEAGTRDVRIEVRRGGIIEGHLVTKRGLTMRWADVYLRGPWTNRRVRADENGYYRIGGIAPGRYVLCAEALDGYGGEREITVPVGRTTIDLLVPDR